MQNILFKARLTETKEWVESPSINVQYDMFGKQHVYIGLPSKSKLALLQRTVCWEEVDPETVGRFSGMTDCVGRNIFEGDVLKTNEGLLVTVFWSDNYRQFRVRGFYDDTYIQNLCKFESSQVNILGTEFGFQYDTKEKEG